MQSIRLFLLQKFRHFFFVILCLLFLLLFKRFNNSTLLDDKNVASLIEARSYTLSKAYIVAHAIETVHSPVCTLFYMISLYLKAAPKCL